MIFPNRTVNIKTDFSVWFFKKNDISFLISGTLTLYEHQSSYNPNMPIRGLMYFARLYDKYIVENHINIFSSALKKLPLPQHFVFYNGTSEEPDRKILRLSDAFIQSSENSYPCLECTATMLNINYGHNRELMEKCRRLEEYALFVASIRTHLANGKDLEMAVTNAVNECIDHNILKDILTKQKSEVVQMVLETFNQEDYEKDIHADGYAQGEKSGQAKERENSIKTLIKLHLDYNLPRKKAHQKLMEEYSLSSDEAEEYLQKYWKS